MRFWLDDCWSALFLGSISLIGFCLAQNDASDLILSDYPGHRTMSGSLCLGGSSRLVTPSYLSGYRYNDCFDTCRGDYNCAGFAIRPSDGVCFAVSTGCMLRDDPDWCFYRRNGAGPIQVEAETTQRTLPPTTFRPLTTSSDIQRVTNWVSYPEFTYVGNHCQGIPLGSKEFESSDRCRSYCLSQATCFGFSIRFDGVCIAKTNQCQWVSDSQWGFYLRTYRAVLVPGSAPLPMTTTTTWRTTTTTAPWTPPMIRTRPILAPSTQRPIIIVQFVPVGMSPSNWSDGWPTYSGFTLMNGHCQGGALQNDYIFSGISCRSACLSNPSCFGFSMRPDGLCLPKSKTCTWSSQPVDDWKFYKLISNPESAPQPFLAVIQAQDLPNFLMTPPPPPPPPPPSNNCDPCHHRNQ